MKHIKKVWQLVKKEWKDTRGWFLFEVVFTGILIITSVSSIKLAIESENKVWYFVAWWQFSYGILFLLWSKTQESLRSSQKLVKNCLKLLDNVMESNMQLIKKDLERTLNELSGGAEYIIGTDKNGQKSIMCIQCGNASYNPDDIKNLYCGNCNKFHQKK